MRSLWDAHNGDPTLRSAGSVLDQRPFSVSCFSVTFLQFLSQNYLIPYPSQLLMPFQSLLRLFKVLLVFLHIYSAFTIIIYFQEGVPLFHSYIRSIFSSNVFFLSLLFCFPSTPLLYSFFFLNFSVFFFYFYAIHHKTMDNVRSIASIFCSPFWGRSLTSLSNYLECMHICVLLWAHTIFCKPFSS